MRTNHRFGPASLDSVAGNVEDLERVLREVEELAGLKPFLRFELELAQGPVPVALLMCGDTALEFLAHAQGARPAGVGHVARVLLEAPGRGPAERELEPNLVLALQPGPKLRVVEVTVASSAVMDDVAVLQAGCGMTFSEAGEGAAVGHLGQVSLHFSALPGTPLPAAERKALDPEQSLPGWHRLGLSCRRLEPAVEALLEAGAVERVPPYRVLPGLREAMLALPSGLVVQPVEQKLWRMLLAMGWRGLVARLTGRPLHFGEQPIGS